MNLNYLRTILLVNTLLATSFFSSTVVAQTVDQICKQDDLTPGEKTECEEIRRNTLEAARINSERELFEARLPDTGDIDSLDGTIAADDNTFKFENTLLAKAAMEIAVSNLSEELKDDLITDTGNKIYVYPQNEGDGNFFSAYQKYDYFNLQYNSLVTEYGNKGIILNNKDSYFNNLRGLPPSDASAVPALGAISAVAGSLIQIGQLFNVNTQFEPSVPDGLTTDTLVGEIYQQLNNDNKNEIYYPKIHSLEKQALDTIIENIIELLYLQQEGLERMESDPDDNEIGTLNNQVAMLLKNISIASTDSTQQNTTSVVLSETAESTISSLANGYSLYENLKPGGDDTKPVYILYVTPTFGGSLRLTQSLFGGAARVSGGIIVDYKLYQINDQIGSSRIRKAGTVDNYIRLQKVNDDFPDNIEQERDTTDISSN